MKLFVASVFFAVVAADRLENTYLPPNSAKSAGGNGNFLNAPNNQYGAPSGQGSSEKIGVSGSGSFGGSYSGAGQSAEAGAEILRFDNENNGDGSYRFEFETENKISQQESGELKNIGTEQEGSVVQGSYSYMGPDGIQYTVNYIADENGFRATGDHIPTAPPIPEEIQRSLQQQDSENEYQQGGNGYQQGNSGYQQESNGNQKSNGYQQQSGNSYQQGGNGYQHGGNGNQQGNGFHSRNQQNQATNRQYLAPNKSNQQQSGYQY